MAFVTELRQVVLLGASLAVGVGLVGLVSTPAHAAEVEVTTFDELVTAITAANGTTEPDTITFGEGISRINFTDDLPEITSPIHFDGPGAASLTLDFRDHDPFRLAGAGEVSITGVTITKSLPPSSFHSQAIFSTDTDLVLRDVVVSNSGSIALQFSGGSVLIEDSEFVNADWSGAWIIAEADDTVTVRRTVFAGNGGAGLFLILFDEAVALLEDVESRDNTDDGEGIALLAMGESTTTFDGVTATGNEGTGVSVSASESSTVTVQGVDSGSNLSGLSVDARDDAEVVVSGLRATGNREGGISIEAEGSSSVRVVDSGLSENGHGAGATLGDGSRFSVERTTIANNVSGAMVGELQDGSLLEVVNSTLSGNGVGEDCGAGLSFYGDSDAAVLLTLSTVVDNADGSCPQVGLDVPATISHSIISGTEWDLASSRDLVVEYSLIGTTDPSFPIAGAAIAAGSGNLFGVDPLLGPLADNGGSTWTHLPAADSPVLNAGDPGIVGAPSSDQRGEARISGSAVDLGAVEVQARLAATGVSLGAAVTAGSLLMLAGVGLLALQLRRRPPTFVG